MGTVLGMAASTTMGMASNPQSSMILWVLQGTVAASIGIGLVMAASITMGTLSTLRISDHSFSDNGNCRIISLQIQSTVPILPCS
eukprot:XP_027305633.1 uncharacterized protein LOC113842437 isoform X4 [Anas platyrhynchos]